ncbi:MAG: hypothetical protein J5497_08420, partial [Selenomonadaceae bacterium]|nr:hypothetical protein [Selenomonadaceae bacterium]
GVTYTAITDAKLNLDSDNKVSGIASGKVKAVVTGAKNSPTATFDGTKPLEFTCAGDDDKLKITCAGSSIDYTSGNVIYSGSGVTFQSGTVGLSGMIAKIIPYSVNLNVPTAGVSATFNGDNLNLKSPDTVTATLNLPEGLSVVLENLKGILPALLKVSEPTFEKIYDIAQKLLTTETSIKFSGEATYNKETKSLSFAQDSSADINALGYEVNLKAVDGALDGISFYYKKGGNDIAAGVKLAASSGDGKLKLDVLKNGVTLFNDILKITNGTLTLDPINAKVLMDANTSLSMTVRDIYTAKLTANNALSTTFSADEKGNIVLTPENFSVKATLQRDNATIFDGTISVENGSLFFNQESHSINVTQGTTLTFKHATHSASLTATDDAGVKIVADNDGNFTITPGKNDGSLNFSLSKGDKLVLGGNLSLSNGSLVFNPAKQEISFTEGTTSVITVGDHSISLTATDTATFKIKIDADGSFIFTMGENDGSLDITIKRGDTPIFSNNVSVVGKITFNPTTQSISLADGTKMSVKFGNYEVTATADGDAAVSVAITSAGLSITPNTGDGTLNLQLGSANGSM